MIIYLYTFKNKYLHIFDLQWFSITWLIKEIIQTTTFAGIYNIKND